MLGLAPNAARIAIRFFHRGTLAELLDNLRRHHRDIRVAPQPAAGKRSADPEFPPVWLLLRQAARDSKEIPRSSVAHSCALFSPALGTPTHSTRPSFVASVRMPP